MILSVAIWSVHARLVRNPAWLFLSLFSIFGLILSRIALAIALLIMLNSVIALQLSHLFLSTSFGILTTMSFCHSSAFLSLVY